MDTIPVIVAIAVGVVGLSLTIASFVMVAARGGWQKAMQATPDGRAPLPRRLMILGAMLGVTFAVLFVILTFIPGLLPWNK